MVFKPDYEVFNLGVSGTTLRTDTAHPWKSTVQYQKAKDSNADFVMIMLGINDCHKEGKEYDEDKMIAEYRSLIQEMKALPSKPEIRLMNYPPMYRSDGGMNQTLVNTFLPRLVRKVARAEGIPQKNIVDLFTPMGGHELSHYELFCNGQSCDTHPNDAGYSEIASLVYHNYFY